ncbi:MAG: cytochrome c oxidase assembly protein [Methylocystis sp.]
MLIEPLLILALTAAAVLFAAGLLRKSKGVAPSLVDWRRAGFYASGLLVTLLALLSPIDDASDRLVSVHMAQHMMLVLIAAPLLAESRFEVAWLWALSPQSRTRLAHFHGRLRRSTPWRILASPGVVWFVFVASFVVWHVPGPYRAALRSPLLHELEHLSLLLAAILFWNGALRASGESHRGVAILCVATAAVATGLSGALIFFSPHPLYATPPASEGARVMEDQQIAGLLMWILGDAVYLFFIGRIALGYFAAENWSCATAPDVSPSPVRLTRDSL